MVKIKSTNNSFFLFPLCDLFLCFALSALFCVKLSFLLLVCCSYFCYFLLLLLLLLFGIPSFLFNWPCGYTFLVYVYASLTYNVCMKFLLYHFVYNVGPYTSVILFTLYPILHSFIDTCLLLFHNTVSHNTFLFFL